MRILGWLLAQPNNSSTRVFISKALEVYQSMNDIVMALAIGAIALFSSNQSLVALVDPKQYQRWCRSLLDLLRKMGLWHRAAEFVFLSPIPEVRSISHARTGINLACNACKREQEASGSACAKCASRLSDCALCGDAVKGLWVACQGCGHGGHAKHIEAWFETYPNTCPVPDCDHQCR